MEKGSSSISNPIPSSTVILIRDVGKGPEILLVLRHKKASFGANYVFPGGTLESIGELTLNNDAVRSEKMNLAVHLIIALQFESYLKRLVFYWCIRPTIPV